MLQCVCAPTESVQSESRSRLWKKAFVAGYLGLDSYQGEPAALAFGPVPIAQNRKRKRNIKDENFVKPDDTMPQYERETSPSSFLRIKSFAGSPTEIKEDVSKIMQFEETNHNGAMALTTSARKGLLSAIKICKLHLFRYKPHHETSQTGAG